MIYKAQLFKGWMSIYQLKPYLPYSENNMMKVSTGS